MGKVLDAFVEAGAVYVDEHFVLKSGRHSDCYVNPDAIMPLPSLFDPITLAMAVPFVDEVDSYLVCVGPDFGGNYLARDVARQLSDLSDTGVDVYWIATRKLANGDFIIEPDRGFEQILDVATSVLFVEDLLTTGGSVRRMMKAFTPWEETLDVLGVTVAINRGGVTAEQLGVPKLASVEEIEVETDEPHACRWCAIERPIVEDIAHGAEFKETNPRYTGGYVKLLG